MFQNLSLDQNATGDSHEELRLSVSDRRSTGSEAAAMDRTWAELSEGLEVLGSGVAFVIPKPILGILRVHFGHKVVAEVLLGDGKVTEVRHNANSFNSQMLRRTRR